MICNDAPHLDAILGSVEGRIKLLGALVVPRMGQSLTRPSTLPRSITYEMKSFS